jgi:hypothetical protein
MKYDFIKYDGSVSLSPKCKYDSNLGFSSNFSIDGEVDKWETYSNIHTYGCWGGFLFGTLYGSSAYIGRSETFLPVPAENFYFVKLSMKVDLVERVGSQEEPTQALLAWRTLTDPIWDSDKQHLFNITVDGEWINYDIDMSPAQWWQGDIIDLRIYPIFNNARSGDKFFIKTIDIYSNNTNKCLNTGCSYYSNYTSDCGGIGSRGYCKSQRLSSVVSGGSSFDFAIEQSFNIEEDVNDVLYININGYGYESIKIPPMENVSGEYLARIIGIKISKIDVGGYAECEVEYNSLGQFIIYSGTYNNYSTAVVGDSALARTLNFFDSAGNSVSTVGVGEEPASGFLSASSFKLKSHQLYGLFNGERDSKFYFDPGRPVIEGGRSDWLKTGLGSANLSGDSTGQATPVRYYDYINNVGRTVIDFCHPFNASGRINKIFAAITLDVGDFTRGENDATRKANQLYGAKVVFFRPKRDGSISLLPFSVDIEDRDFSDNRLYSAIQEYIEIDCDIFVNKGDLIGIYNANVYIGKSSVSQEVDALYYSGPDIPVENITLQQPSGDGSGGLLVYACSSQIQDKLVVDIDLGHRINIESINIDGEVENTALDFNIARCLDINWNVELFDEDHTTYYVQDVGGLQVPKFFNHPNTYYGKNRLNDGVKISSAGLAAESYSVELSTSYSNYESASGKQDGGVGVVLSDAKYFCLNGDQEWLDTYLHVGNNKYDQKVLDDFERDSIAFSLFFPNNTEHLIHKAVIYFKERDNFRSFAQSLYRGPTHSDGDADDNRFDLIPYRTDGTETPWTKITLDGVVYEPDDDFRWESISLYLANNPCIGHPIKYYLDSSSFVVVNMEQWQQALANDWTVMGFEWEPTYAKGYRFYCDYHRSTKICEFELYAIMEATNSTFSSSVDVRYSSYGDVWWPSANEIDTTGSKSFIGDTPRYVELTLKPLSKTLFSNIDLSISSPDMFIGQKGCQDIILPDTAKIGQTNQSSMVSFKNVYGAKYDLTVDISQNMVNKKDTIFYSKLNNYASISNPEIGADAYYKKQADYKLFNYQKNVAINCPVYALNSLVDGAHAWYTHDREYSWKYWGQLSAGEEVDFSNLPNTAITTLNLPVIVRSKWWKIGFLDPRIIASIKEIQIYYEDEEIETITFYHHIGQDAIYGSNTDEAPHLRNRIVDGSYYVLTGDNYIGFEFDSVRSFDKIILYHSFKEMYENSHDIAGIDIATSLCIHGEGEHGHTTDIKDVSYYEHPASVIGSNIYCDIGYTDSSYSFTEDFSECENIVDYFEGPSIDTDIWTDIVNASIIDESLHITNSGTIGKVATIHTFDNDFDIRVDLEIVDKESNPGWGGYLSATSSGLNDAFVRIGRTYHADQGHAFVGQSYSDLGWAELGVETTSDVTQLKLRLARTDDLMVCYAYDQSNTWYEIGSSTALGTSSINIELISDLTPLAIDTTTAVFDNFEVTSAGNGWGINTHYGSSFTCVSGINPTISGGYAYRYEIKGTGAKSEASAYKLPQVFDYQSDPIDQDFEFTFDFVLNAEDFLDGGDNSVDWCGISVGPIGFHTVNNYYLTSTWWPYFTGAQVVFRRDDVGIAVKSDHSDTTSVYDPPNVDSSYVDFDTDGDMYFCRFTHDGEGNYRIVIWTDDFDGSSEIIDHSLTSSNKWEVHKIGIGSAPGHDSYSGFTVTGTFPYHTCIGWIGNLSFTSTKRSNHGKIENSSIRFSGNDNEYILVSWENSSNCNYVRETFNFSDKNFTIDTYIKFNSLPESDGEFAVIAMCWDPSEAFNIGSTIYTNSSWAFILERVNRSYYWRLYANIDNKVRRLLNHEFYPDLYRWYHFYLCRNENINDSWVFLKDGHSIANGYDSGNTYWTDTIVKKEQDIIVGKNLDGWLREFRISADFTPGGGRVEGYNSLYRRFSKSIPTSPYERYYTFSVYNSNDNVVYGKCMDVDTLFDNSYSYHEPLSYWSEPYYTYFAIDFGQRHDIDIVRSYPVDTSYQFDKDSNMLFSNKDTSDPVTAFILTASEQILDTDFTGMDYDYPELWAKIDDTHTESYIIDNKFYQHVDATGGAVSSIASLNPYLAGDFDIQIDFDFISGIFDTNSWMCGIKIEDLNDSNNAIKIERGYNIDRNIYRLLVKDDSSTWTVITTIYRNDVTKTIRLVRSTTDFIVYTRDVGSTDAFDFLCFYQTVGGFGYESKLELYLSSLEDEYPSASVWWDNFVVNSATPIYSSSNDTRWARIKLLNGDGVDRTIKKLDIYPDVSVLSSPAGQHNNYWTSLGTSITSYALDENIALGCTVSGSSEVGTMETYRVTDGIIEDGSINDCWGGDEDLPQWITIHLNELTEIYRIKIHHGYDTERADNIIQDYLVQTSLDNETFTTIFTVTDNVLFERVHDLSSPVQASYVRLYITKYIATEKFVWKSEEDDFQFWAGPMLREVEIFKYYGFTSINSEDTPVISIDLQERFFIEGTSFVGTDSEDDSNDWTDDDVVKTYSNSDLSDPKKVNFRDWGSSTVYDKWLVFKNNIATGYPTAEDTPKHLKHVVVTASVDEDGHKPNSLEYPWMWKSSVSTLSYDYDKVMLGYGAKRSLSIEYDAGTSTDHVYFVEGDYFGYDNTATWRDGLGLFWYIDDLSNIDLNYGYIYLGGWDDTPHENTVTYKWNFSTISGVLQSGWNNLILTLSKADDVDYTENVNYDDPRRPDALKWGKMGMVYRGVGNPLNMNIDGAWLAKNHFEHWCFRDYGLYLQGNDILKINAGELNLTSGALDFCIRTDWTFDGKDIYNDFKFRALFHIANVANDVFGAMITENGLEIYFGNLSNDLNTLLVNNLLEYDIIDTVMHMAFVFSNDGSSISSDKSTVRFYINNELIAKSNTTWQVQDNKYFNLTIGGQGILGPKARHWAQKTSSVAGVIGRLKIYNYCRTDFRDSVDAITSSEQESLISPDQLIEVSKDNLTFYSVGDEGLPLTFSGVEPDETVSVYTRVVLPENSYFTGAEKRTAYLISSWDIGV